MFVGIANFITVAHELQLIRSVKSRITAFPSPRELDRRTAVNQTPLQPTTKKAFPQINPQKDQLKTI
ncbi:hypothetical protein ABM34_06130 [Companilactobacillus ginsenosidimutans]|uniref:Uncharacterized protein n=1 Tax=Companilactobacillus ginsenosidimutans TaxID=1007676 RepID=A0A0H4QKC9_9LACO|nr:hypothetical protein ABM34_06130 [Companilactobacillus ginsenosidimutans]